jgi:hypothetical protein
MMLKTGFIRFKPALSTVLRRAKRKEEKIVTSAKDIAELRRMEVLENRLLARRNAICENL